MNEMTCVLAKLEDMPGVLDMMEDFNRLEEIAWSRAPGEEALKKLLGDSSLGVVGILREGGAAIGYFVLTWGYDLEWNGRDAFLTELYLVPAARGQGRGRASLVLIESIGKEHGVKALHLMVRPENIPARRLYQAAGYQSPPRVFLTKDLR
jgi:ribosomal protein S18 acetylase RimI-like enzyme